MFHCLTLRSGIARIFYEDIVQGRLIDLHFVNVIMLNKASHNGFFLFRRSELDQQSTVFHYLAGRAEISLDLIGIFCANHKAVTGIVPLDVMEVTGKDNLTCIDNGNAVTEFLDLTHLMTGEQHDHTLAALLLDNIH